ncbi:Bug family tripartite tricarboxylate transporter substrate binding protein [Falsiroseomonas oryziterrae]|uniref:Bug family tripartite tricarboxylate transporter substrate binding protein n=1 Tax=Falsiroseomonas oryziterrae TaxID=2911368 RepID=UPI001F222DA6|nr:tripartite tricarboxylate transporter substrate-binding protein [Roseomonas sp. NPKOSM-4]
MTTMLPRRALAGFGLMLAAPAIARAQAAWPDRPVRMIVPFAPGGAFDVVARAMATHFPRFANGQALQVDNRPGAGGTIAGALAARERPDGSTFMLADLAPNVVGHEMFAALPYDPRTAFVPVVHAVNIPTVLVARPGFAARDVPAVIAAARAEPGRLTYSTPGAGNAVQFMMEHFQRLTNTRMTHVPYRSGAEAATALVRGDVDLSFTSISSALPFLQDGRARPIAVSTARRVATLPEVPAIAETVPGFDVAVWTGVVAPAGITPDLLARANAVFNQVLAVPELRENLARVQAADVVGGTPEAFGAFITAARERWTPIIRELGIRLE